MKYFRGLVESSASIYFIGEGGIKALSAGRSNGPCDDRSALRFWTSGWYLILPQTPWMNQKSFCASARHLQD